jgi:hypothetical protein
MTRIVTLPIAGGFFVGLAVALVFIAVDAWTFEAVLVCGVAAAAGTAFVYFGGVPSSGVSPQHELEAFAHADPQDADARSSD